MDEISLAQLLLQVKYTPPVSRGPLVARPRLTEKLQHGSAGTLTLIAAPAGSGKTTLVADWLCNPATKANAPAYVWLSLDAEDNDPVRFLRHLAAGLQRIDHSLGQALDPILGAAQMANRDNLAELAAAVLLNALANGDEPLLIILDDYHFISNEQVNRFVQALLNHPPAHLHLIVLSRTQPALPLSRLRVRNQLTEISSNELFFSDGEAANFYRDVMHLQLSPNALARLAQRTEGWVAALQLAGLSLQGQADPEAFVASFGGSDRYLVDYLLEDVLQKLPPELFEFLLQTSILDRLESRLCDAVTGRSDSQSLLTTLEERNLFLMPLDNQRHYYRYHHLFADFLRKRLQEAQPAAVSHLHLRACDWFATHELPEAAIAHALAAGDATRSAALIEQNAATLLWQRGQVTMLRQWLELLPLSLRRQRAYLTLLEAWLLYLAGAGKAVDELLDQLESALQAESRAAEDQAGMGLGEQVGYICILRAERAMLKGHMQEADGYFQRARQVLPASDLVGQSFVEHGLGLVYTTAGEFSQAEKSFQRALTLSESTHNLTFRKLVLYDWGALCQLQGRLELAEARLDDALQLEATLDPWGNPVAGAVPIVLGIVCYEQDRLDEAFSYLERGVVRWQQHTMPGMAHLGQAYLSLLEWVNGQSEAATVRIKHALAIWHTFKSPSARALLGAHVVRAALKQGLVEWVVPWAAAVQQNSQANLPRYYRHVDEVVLARYYRAKGEHVLAEELLLQAHATASSHHWQHSLIEIEILLALLYQAKGEQNRAQLRLSSALQLAEPGGYVRSFVDEGALLAEMLRRQTSGVVSAGYLGKLQASFMPVAQVDAPTAPLLLDPLTEREQKVLQLMAMGLANREIADELVIALGTVAKYSNNIFTKLAVANRTQAISRAQKLGLL